MTATAIVPTTETLQVPGARLSYDVRRNDESTDPILFLIAAPMAAAGFGTLAGHFTDRTVVTYDPRGSERSELTEPTIPPTPEEHAADLHHFITLVSHRGAFPADFAQQPGPDPAMFGMPTEDDGSRTDPLPGLALVGSIEYAPDLDALRAAYTRIVMAAGAESEGELANRGALPSPSGSAPSR